MGPLETTLNLLRDFDERCKELGRAQHELGSLPRRGMSGTMHHPLYLWTKSLDELNFQPYRDTDEDVLRGIATHIAALDLPDSFKSNAKEFVARFSSFLDRQPFLHWHEGNVPTYRVIFSTIVNGHWRYPDEAESCDVFRSIADSQFHAASSMGFLAKDVVQLLAPTTSEGKPSEPQ